MKSKENNTFAQTKNENSERNLTKNTDNDNNNGYGDKNSNQKQLNGNYTDTETDKRTTDKGKTYRNSKGNQNMTVVAASKLTSKGQVTIPIEIRKALELKEGDNVVFKINEDGMYSFEIVKTRPLSSLIGALSVADRDFDVPRDFSEIRREAYRKMAGNKFSGKDR